MIRSGFFDLKHSSFLKVRLTFSNTFFYRYFCQPERLERLDALADCLADRLIWRFVCLADGGAVCVLKAALVVSARSLWLLVDGCARCLSWFLVDGCTRCIAGCLPCRLVDGCTLAFSTAVFCLLISLLSRHPRRCSGTSKIPTSICASISSFSPIPSHNCWSSPSP
jgi:hypothetical protein